MDGGLSTNMIYIYETKKCSFITWTLKLKAVITLFSQFKNVYIRFWTLI